ncbi:hypothetical protein HDU96_002003 [Phlyctochytrium bullatum]|nr:hypothetical protein HDU96_002003 [Phlyctochytrium bullatum]
MAPHHLSTRRPNPYEDPNFPFQPPSIDFLPDEADRVALEHLHSATKKKPRRLKSVIQAARNALVGRNREGRAHTLDAVAGPFARSKPVAPAPATHLNVAAVNDKDQLGGRSFSQSLSGEDVEDSSASSDPIVKSWPTIPRSYSSLTRRKALRLPPSFSWDSIQDPSLIPATTVRDDAQVATQSPHVIRRLPPGLVEIPPPPACAPPASLRNGSPVSDWNGVSAFCQESPLDSPTLSLLWPSIAAEGTRRWTASTGGVDSSCTSDSSLRRRVSIPPRRASLQFGSDGGSSFIERRSPTVSEASVIKEEEGDEETDVTAEDNDDADSNITIIGPRPKLIPFPPPPDHAPPPSVLSSRYLEPIRVEPSSSSISPCSASTVNTLRNSCDSSPPSLPRRSPSTDTICPSPPPPRNLPSIPSNSATGYKGAATHRQQHGEAAAPMVASETALPVPHKGRNKTSSPTPRRARTTVPVRNRPAPVASATGAKSTIPGAILRTTVAVTAHLAACAANIIFPRHPQARRDAIADAIWIPLNVHRGGVGGGSGDTQEIAGANAPAVSSAETKVAYVERKTPVPLPWAHAARQLILRSAKAVGTVSPMGELWTKALGRKVMGGSWDVNATKPEYPKLFMLVWGLVFAWYVFS